MIKRRENEGGKAFFGFFFLVCLFVFLLFFVFAFVVVAVFFPLNIMKIRKVKIGARYQITL